MCAELPSSALVDGDSEQFIPLTSVLCRWNVPTARKESNLQISEAVFEKHDYQKPVKKRRKHIEEFDPRPEDCRRNANQLLTTLLENVRGESLGISLLFDERYSQPGLLHADTSLPSTPHIQKTVEAFKESLRLSPSQLRHVELSTREQRNSYEWYSMRRYRITASRFGEILHRRLDTPPDRLVLSILQPRKFSSLATTWGIENEPKAIQAYVEHKRSCGIDNIVVAPCGLFVSGPYPFLGATPDGAVHDPSATDQPYGFLEVKCPYSHRDHTPAEACKMPGFCCSMETLPGGTHQIKLRSNHLYYAQVQGQMAVGDRPWCDFVIYTTKGINIERIYVDTNYWSNTLLPKLVGF